MDIRPTSNRARPVASPRLKQAAVVSDTKKTSVGDVTPPKHRSAQSIHERAHTGRNDVLDLRTKQPAVSPAAVDPKPEAKVIRHEAPHTPKPAVRTAPVPSERLERAKTTPLSESISRFGVKHAIPQNAVVVDDTPAPRPETKASLPTPAVTQHESLTKILATIYDEPINSLKTSRTGRIAATVAAISILAGYVWVVNYPKLAITSAGNQAGISASLPGYLPSSYHLATTTTAPGIVTLQFASPSQSSPLTITQHRTSWDSNSLLDNYVTKVANDYSSVEGQGLTVYLFDADNASWINHGVWYSIAGTARLSREQILKIAYSL